MSNDLTIQDYYDVILERLNMRINVLSTANPRLSDSVTRKKGRQMAYAQGMVETLILVGFRIHWDESGEAASIELPDYMRSLMANG